MALTQSSGVAVRAGLVFQAVGLNEHLKIALRDAGVNVVAEIIANALSLDQIREANLDVFVVNLDPELEDSLDELTDMLDQMRRPVIFNDGAASSGLAGWDQARWARHLAAKITGELDSSPPRPADAKSIPSPVKVVPPKVVVAPVVVMPVVALPEVAVTQSVPSQSIPVNVSVEVAREAVVINEQPSMPLNNEVPSTDPLLDEVFTELDFDFDIESANQAVPVRIDDEESGLEGFDASAFDMPESATPNFAVEELSDLDELFRGSASPDDGGMPDVEPAKVELAAAKGPSLADLAVSPEQKPQSKPVVTLKTDVSALNWSLEPLEGEYVAPVPTGRAVYVAKEVPPLPEVAQKVAAKTVTAAAAQPVQDDSNELGDFDFFLDEDGLEAPPASAPIAASAPTIDTEILPTPSSAAVTKRLPAIESPAEVNIRSTASELPSAALADEMSDFDALFADLNDLSPVTMPAAGESANSKDSDTAFDSSSLDFDLDFEVGAPHGSTVEEKDEDFADLDALFADTPVAVTPERGASATQAPTAPTGPARIFVLGASIGGPEAIRSFLGKLKPNLPAAFVLAQHMGAEFLELMTSQLAKASPMPVRLAVPGESFVAGEIVVVPVNQRFLVDQLSVVQFAPLPTESPYSPSIDQVMIDMADRFGSRCTGIVFSGMASDAIEGAKYLASRGAKVWVQDPATCDISKMIDGEQAAGVVSFVGAPEQLADHVLDELGALN